MSGCSPVEPPRDQKPVETPIDCTTSSCPAQRNFVIVFGEPGLGKHYQGQNFRFAAETHVQEVTANAFSGTPRFLPTDGVLLALCATVRDLVDMLKGGNVIYLAYFGHSGPQALNIGEGALADTNLTNLDGPYNTPVRKLPPARFRSDAQVRLFGCKAGLGDRPIAKQIASHLHLPVFAYTNSGGAIFTTDRRLGHGKRLVKHADIDAKPPNNPRNLWLIPINDTPTFGHFDP